MEREGPRWLLPNAAWQGIAYHLPLDDLVSARLVCSSWRRDLSAFISQATVSSTQLLASSRGLQPSSAAETAAALSAASQEVAALAREQAMALSGAIDTQAGDPSNTETPCESTSRRATCSPAAAVLALSEAFPDCETICLDISSADKQQLVHKVLKAVADRGLDNNTKHVGGCTSQPAGSTAVEDSPSAEVESTAESNSSVAASNRKHSTMKVCLDAMQRSYHCLARQEYPGRPDGTGPELFKLLSQLPQQLSPSALNGMTSLQLDVCPEQPQDWLVLQQLPGLRELLLPGFKPAVPHQHLSALAHITQLTAATLSVQGSFTSWRANCDAFSSLSRLTALTSLTLHAFHCPGHQLMAALGAMKGLVELRLSGRVVLEPLSALHQLTGLQVLELTQDVQYSALCDLVHHLSAVTQLAVGRVNLPPITTTLAAADMWQPPAVADGGGGAVAAPAAAAEAAAVVVAADAGGGGAAAAAAAAEGGVGEVMLEDVGAIVDGLIGNLQEGNVPVHLQRIIERFESIIQLDLTRSTATSPWGWPVLGTPLLQQLSSCGYNDAPSSWQCKKRVSQANRSSSSCNNGVSGLELALLRPNDVVRLDELPQQVRCCRHLGLRLRDQLLAFASVCPIRLAQGQLSSIGGTFTCLQSLSVCGKVAIDGTTLSQLTNSLGSSPPTAGTPGPSAAATAAGCFSRPGGLLALSLDCHFVSVSAESVIQALQSLPGLKVLSLRHRGQGKLPLPLNALPHGLVTLAVKKVLLYKEQPTQSSHPHSSSWNNSSSSPPGPASGCHVAVPDSNDVHCHAITSPGFKRAAATGKISTVPSTADLAALSAELGDDRTSQTSGSSEQVLLPKLESLLLKNCLVATEAIHSLLGVPAAGIHEGGSDALGGCHLTKLSITGDNSSHTEVVEGWSTWLQVIGHLRRLQVLDLAVPESLGCSLPPELLHVLLNLPRLAHLHLTTGHQPLQLLGLTGLRGIRTISLHYSGPPTLPSQLLGQLQAGVGPHCKVRLWEMLVLQHVNSFGGSGSGGGGVDAVEGEGRVRCRQRGGRVMRHLVGAVGWVAIGVGGWWCGWKLGGALEHSRLKRRNRKQVAWA